jgi:hypothetical protein
MPGEVLTCVLSQNNPGVQLDNRATGFSGYIIAECNFRYANGFAYIGTIGGRPRPDLPSASTCYLAKEIKSDCSGE